MTNLKVMNKRRLTVFLAFMIIIGMLALWGYANRTQLDKKHMYVSEYVIGAPGIKGTVDITQWGEDPAYHIGANRAGYAVFKDPDQAFARMKLDYAAGIEAIQEEYGLSSLSLENYQQYGTYGWQLTESEDAEAVEQSRRVTVFMDILENSYVD